MRLFLFNEILPKSIVIQDAVKALEKTIIEYKNIKNEYPDSIDGIVTSSLLENIIISDDISLSNCVKEIKDNSLRGYAYSLFLKFPIDNFFDVDTVLSKGIEYFFKIDGINQDALNIKILSNENGCLFSLNLHDDLGKNSLTITSIDNTFEINNLYGDIDNTNFIKELINSDLQAKSDSLEKLQFVLKTPFLSTKFKKEFNTVSKEIQDLIIDGFNTIIKNKNNGINTPETLLKDVTPAKEVEISLKELKIRKPIAKRIYFTEIEEKYYIASLENKPLKDGRTNEQSNHIKNAVSQIKQLVRLN